MEQDLYSVQCKDVWQEMPYTLEENSIHMCKKNVIRELDEIYNDTEDFTSHLGWKLLVSRDPNVQLYDMNTLVMPEPKRFKISVKPGGKQTSFMHSFAEARSADAWTYHGYGWASDAAHAMWLCK